MSILYAALSSPALMVADVTQAAEGRARALALRPGFGSNLSDCTCPSSCGTRSDEAPHRSQHANRALTLSSMQYPIRVLEETQSWRGRRITATVASGRKECQEEDQLNQSSSKVLLAWGSRPSRSWWMLDLKSGHGWGPLHLSSG